MEKFYITTSIAYTNAPPHIGFALELIQADVLARYDRLLGEDVFFLTGTDEHGIKIAKTAKESGKNPKDFVDEISEKYRNLGEVLNISNNDFIRTTDKKRHWPVVEKVWKNLEKSGDIYKRHYEGLYCEGCEAFITERTKSLAYARCLLHPNLEPVLIKEENYFFRLSKYQNKIKQFIGKNEIKIIPETKKNEILEILNQEWTDFETGEKKRGLKDISFSRESKNLEWGISVPNDPSQKIYIWADALINYASALGYPDGANFKKYWPADVHCIGKDILKFHALIWPAMLLSLGLSLPKTIFVHGFITVGSQKMSKSLGNVVDPFELVEKYGTDAVRYFLLREIPSTEDGDFTYEKFEQRYNSDLASGIGNLLARVRVMAEEVDFANVLPSEKVIKYLAEVKFKWQNSIENFRFNEALFSIWDVIHYCDSYINETEPWERKENDKQALRDLIEALFCICLELLPPFLPETADKIFAEIEIDKKTGKFKNKRGKILFPRI